MANSKNLSDDQLNEHLKKLKFSDEELKNLSHDVKIDIASHGGKKIVSTKLDPEIYNVDEKGIRTKLVKGDFSAQKYTSSDFELWGTVLNLGSVSSTENAYAVYSEYKWKTGPFNAYTDKLALAWQSQAIPYGSPSGTHYWYSSGGTHSFIKSVHQQLVQGDSWNVDVIAGGDQQDGWGRQELRVAKSYQGTTGAVVLGYAHRYAPGSTGVSLSYGIISFSGSLQTEYNDRLNFTY